MSLQHLAVPVLLLSSVVSHASELTVNSAGTASFTTIQSAILAAQNGDIIVVEPGTYTGSGANVIDPLGKSITIRSRDGAESTIIDGEGARRGIFCQSGETSDTVIDGFTIQNCAAPLFDWDEDGNFDDSYGGAIGCFSSSPTLINCVLTESSAERGGGIAIRNSAMTISKLHVHRQYVHRTWRRALRLQQ